MKEIYLVVSNSDLTEGRGRPVTIAYCATLATAKRVAKKRGVMGSDADVKAYEFTVIEGMGFIPLSLIDIQHPTKEDEAEQKRLDDIEATIKRAKEAGLSDADIRILKSIGS